MFELAIPSVQQKTSYTCGPAALLSVLRYLRVADRASEKSLAKEMATTSQYGTCHKEMLAAARRRWPLAEWRIGLNHDDLVSNIDAGNVLILDMQAWIECGPTYDTVQPVLTDGHYVVATAADSNRAVFMDPSSRARRWLPRRELRYRWIESDYSGGVYYGGALVFAGVEQPRKRVVRWSRVQEMG